MLIKLEHLEGIRSGTVDLAFRRWKRPTVRAGGTLRTRIGVLAVEAVDRIEESSLTEADARRSGFASLEALGKQLKARTTGDLYRIKLRLSGADPRIELRNKADLTEEEAAEIRRRLERFDRFSRRGPWTATTLALIADHPGTRAADLADLAGFDKPWLKTNVRKLKELGLTESLSPGYRLSPRGRKYLELDRPSRPRRKRAR